MAQTSASSDVVDVLLDIQRKQSEVLEALHLLSSKTTSSTPTAPMALLEGSRHDENDDRELLDKTQVSLSGSLGGRRSEQLSTEDVPIAPASPIQRGITSRIVLT